MNLVTCSLFEAYNNNRNFKSVKKMSRSNKYCVTPDQLIKAIMGEMEAKRFYEKLITMTTDEENKKIIRGIIKDEEFHQMEFRKLYVALFRKQPAVPPLGPEREINSFFQGLGMALNDELGAYEFYRDIIMQCYDNRTVMSIFFKVFTDENEHAMIENYMMNKENYNR